MEGHRQMAEITRAGLRTGLWLVPPAASRISDVLAGEDLAVGDACHLNATRQVYRSSGATSGEAADVRGFAAAGARRGETVTLVFDVTMRYGASLPPGRALYLSAAVPGGLADCPSPGGTEPIAFVADAARIHVLQSDHDRTTGPVAGRGSREAGRPCWR
jgi:hypothetical protein